MTDTSHRMRAFRHRAFAGGLAGLLMLAVAACDKGPDREAVAAQLKADVEAQLKLIEGSTTEKVVSHSAVTVTPADDNRYEVAIEGMKFQPSPEGYLDIGTVSYVAIPKDEKTFDVTELKLAPEIPFKGPDGKDQGKLAMTSKAFDGQWSRELGAFLKLTAEFADIVATDNKGADARIDTVKVSNEMTDKGGGLFDSTGNATLGGLTIKSTDGAGAFSLAETVIDAKYAEIKFAAYQAAAKKYQELMLKHVAAVDAAAKANGQPPVISEEDQKAMTAAVTEMAAAIKSGDFKMAFKGMRYSEGAEAPFTLDQLGLGFGVDGINQEKASLTFDLSHQGLAINTPEASTALAKAVLPRSGNLGIKVTEIPSKDLTKVLADNVPGMMSTDVAVAEANGMAMVAALQAVLQTSGAKIEVTPTAVTAEATELKATGAFNVQPQAIFGVVGALDIAMTGLDAVMALAQANPTDPSAQEVIGMVGMLMQYAQRETGADGKPVDKFKIDVKETGEMLVNGKPM